MGKIVDVTGQKFGRLIVLGRSERSSKAGALWVCRCDCGGETVTTSLKLRNGLTKSCGCRKLDGLSNLQHGYSRIKSRTYRTWKEMRQRCSNPKRDQWQWYGGRGISVCPEWNSFETFLGDMGERPERMTLDRIDSDGNYCKANCRWATSKQQAETNRGVFAPGITPKNATPPSVLSKVEHALSSHSTVASAARAAGVSYAIALNLKRRLEKVKGAA